VWRYANLFGNYNIINLFNDIIRVIKMLLIYLNLRYCWLCNAVYQYSETNVIHVSLNLLKIKGLYMFQALVAHPQEALHNRHLVYCVRVMSVGCYQCWS
jgi:hypothetical protein